jgi:hypothetical protein
MSDRVERRGAFVFLTMCAACTTSFRKGVLEHQQRWFYEQLRWYAALDCHYQAGSVHDQLNRVQLRMQMQPYKHARMTCTGLLHPGTDRTNRRNSTQLRLCAVHLLGCLTSLQASIINQVVHLTDTRNLCAPHRPQRLATFSEDMLF